MVSSLLSFFIYLFFLTPLSCPAYWLFQQQLGDDDDRVCWWLLPISFCCPDNNNRVAIFISSQFNELRYNLGALFWSLIDWTTLFCTIGTRPLLSCTTNEEEQPREDLYPPFTLNCLKSLLSFPSTQRSLTSWTMFELFKTKPGPPAFTISFTPKDRLARSIFSAFLSFLPPDPFSFSGFGSMSILFDIAFCFVSFFVLSKKSFNITAAPLIPSFLHFKKLFFGPLVEHLASGTKVWSGYF